MKQRLRYKVTVAKTGRIPGIGLGPIRKPVLITEENYNSLIKMGYPVNIVADLYPDIKESVVTQQPFVAPEPSVTPKKQKDDEVNSSVVKDTEKTEEFIENNDVVSSLSESKKKDEQMEDFEEEAVEIVVNDKDLSAESYYEESFLSSKNMCKKILDKRKVSYDTSSSFTILKQLVMESNPEVEVIEE